MDLRPIQPNQIELVAEWMGEERNFKWLDFGAGRQTLDRFDLDRMIRQDIHDIHVYHAADGVPVGVAALSNINRRFGTATTWFVLGRKEYGLQDLTVRAVARLLEHGFQEMNLRAINAWTVEVNRGAIRILERLHFRIFGRQRLCHYVNGIVYDRLWYDLLDEEYQGFEELGR